MRESHVFDYIEDEIQARGWSLSDLAQRMGGDETKNLAELHILSIKHPKIRLSYPTAKKIARAFGQKAKTWLRLDEAWRGEREAGL